MSGFNLLAGFCNVGTEKAAAAGALTEYTGKAFESGYWEALHVYHYLHCLTNRPYLSLFSHLSFVSPPPSFPCKYIMFPLGILLFCSLLISPLPMRIISRLKSPLNRRLCVWLYWETYHPHISFSITDIPKYVGKLILDSSKHLLVRITNHHTDALRRNTVHNSNIRVDEIIWPNAEGGEPVVKAVGMREFVYWKELDGWAMTRRIDVRSYLIRPIEEQLYQ